MSGTNGDERLDPSEVLDLIHVRLFDAMKVELRKGRGETVKLRKALLLLIVMTAETASEPVRQYIDYLLTEFKPLADDFENHVQDFCRGEWVARAREHAGGHLLLVVP